jgi:hypothetical protein
MEPDYKNKLVTSMAHKIGLKLRREIQPKIKYYMSSENGDRGRHFLMPEFKRWLPIPLNCPHLREQEYSGCCIKNVIT